MTKREATPLTDVPFEKARDVGNITLRLHPLDVGYDLRAEGMSIAQPAGAPDGTLRASYAARDGERRVVEGPYRQVIAWLRGAGYAIDG